MKVWALKRKGTSGVLNHYDFFQKRWYPWFDNHNITLSHMEALAAQLEEDSGEVYSLTITLSLKNK